MFRSRRFEHMSEFDRKSIVEKTLRRTQSECFFFGRKNSVETFFLGRTWSKCSSSVEHSRNIDSLGRVGRKISSLGRGGQNIPFLVESVET